MRNMAAYASTQSVSFGMQQQSCVSLYIKNIHQKEYYKDMMNS